MVGIESDVLNNRKRTGEVALRLYIGFYCLEIRMVPFLYIFITGILFVSAISAMFRDVSNDGLKKNLFYLFKTSLAFVAILVGLKHFWAGFGFGFGGSEEPPSSFFYFLYLGPFSTLPEVLVAVHWPRLGGMLLVWSGLLSMLAYHVFAPGFGQEQLLTIFSYSATMILLGGVFLLLGWHSKKITELKKSLLSGKE